MKNKAQTKSDKKSLFMRVLLFPLAVLVIYAVIAAIWPGKALLAFKNSGTILFNMLLPLGLIFVFMLLINLFLNPSRVATILGKGSGVKGMALSAAAGIISTGPIYAWYPLLKDLKEKGAGESSIAIFLYNRSVKPFLLPVMIAFFGWIYVVILIVITVAASIIVGYCIHLLSPAGKK